MSESIQAAVDLLTVAAAFGVFGVSLWNAYQFSVLKDRVVEQGDNMRAHVNAPRLHRHA